MEKYYIWKNGYFNELDNFADYIMAYYVSNGWLYLKMEKEIAPFYLEKYKEDIAVSDKSTFYGGKTEIVVFKE